MLAFGINTLPYSEPAIQKRPCKRIRISIKFSYTGELLIGSMPVYKEEFEC